MINGYNLIANVGQEIATRADKVFRERWGGGFARGAEQRQYWAAWSDREREAEI